MAGDHRDRPDRGLPDQQARGADDDRPEIREDHQHMLAYERVRPADDGTICSCQRGGEDAHQGHGRGVGEIQHSGERTRSGVLPYRDDQTPGGGPYVRCLDPIANPGWEVG